MIDKSELLIAALDRYETQYNPNRSGEHSISCPNKDAHPDRNPSCSLNIAKGLLFCQGCGLSGDAYSVMMVIEGITFAQAVERIGAPYAQKESDWLL